MKANSLFKALPTPSLVRKPLIAALCVTSVSVTANPQAFQASRSFAMGGTGVAVAQPSAATVANPAMLAATQHEWSDDFGLVLPSVNARFADEEETVDQIDDIQDLIDEFNELETIPGNEAEARAKAGELRRALNDFDRDTVRVDAGVGIALAFPSDTLSVGFFTNGNLRATVRGEFDEDDEQRLRGIEDGSTPLLTVDLDEELESRGRILASGVAEVGLSFATSLYLNNGGQLQVGVSPKYVQLRTFQYTETVSGFDDEDFDSEESETDKSGFNMDVGAAYAFGETQEWNAGVVVKNLIPMELESAANLPSEPTYTLELDPMVTAGIAHSGEFHVVTAELDLTKKKGFGYADDTQWLALGAELDAWRYAQLRFGVRQNLASNDDNDGIAEETQFTAGIGISPFGARLDIGAMISDADVGAALELGAAF